MTAKIFIIRTIIALGAVICLALGGLNGLAWVKWPGFLLYLACFAMYAKALYQALFKMKTVTADLLVVTVMTVSFFAGQPLSGALVAWFISMGLAISFTIIERTGRKINALTKQGRSTVRVVKDNQIVLLPIERVCKGDVVMVPQGEMIPVDGRIVEGASSIDESVVTGEPFAVYKKENDPVVSGSLTMTGPLKIRAGKDGGKGFLHVMAREIESSLKVKPRIHENAHRFVQFFIAGVVVYATGVFVVTALATGDAAAGLMRMAAVTAVACPCAWALSVPTAFAAAIGGLSSKGILVRGGTPLEQAGRAEVVVLDKTGTLTLSQPKVSDITAFDMKKEELLRLAASVEAGFNHPVANAIVRYASEQLIEPLQVHNSEYLPGQGVRSLVTVNGNEQTVVLGTGAMVNSLGLKVPEKIHLGGRGTWIVIDNQVAGVIDIQDRLREDADGLGDLLRAAGIRQVELATGDNEAAEAKRVADRIKADGCRWGLTPHDKKALVTACRDKGITVMVGDGVNDAMSLAAADVGISIGHARADLAIKSSDIIVMRDDAKSLVVILEKGKQLIRIIRQNYAWAISFNTIGILLATAGILSPWLAALVHHFSSVLVVLNSARLIKVKR